MQTLRALGFVWHSAHRFAVHAKNLEVNIRLRKENSLLNSEKYATDLLIVGH